MSKIAIVKNLDSTGPQREQIRTVAELQMMIESVSSQLQSSNELMRNQIRTSVEALDRAFEQRSIQTDQSTEDLRKTLESWRETVLETQTANQQQTLDLAVLIESISPTLVKIQERQIVMDERLTRIESSVARVTMALPPLKDHNGKKVQLTLASSSEMSLLPAKVWESKPPMFGKS